MWGSGGSSKEAGSASKGTCHQSCDLISIRRIHLVEALGTFLPLNKQICLSKPENPRESGGDTATSFRGFPQNWAAVPTGCNPKPQGHLVSVSGHCFPFSAAGTSHSCFEVSAPPTHFVSECQDLWLCSLLWSISQSPVVVLQAP